MNLNKIHGLWHRNWTYEGFVREEFLNLFFLLPLCIINENDLIDKVIRFGFWIGFPSTKVRGQNKVYQNDLQYYIRFYFAS